MCVLFNLTRWPGTDEGHSECTETRIEAHLVRVYQHQPRPSLSHVRRHEESPANVLKPKKETLLVHRKLLFFRSFVVLVVANLSLSLLWRTSYSRLLALKVV